MKGSDYLKNQQLRLYKPPPKDDQSKNYKKLIAVIAISVIFISVEAAGGIISGSISVISDSVHLLTDLVGFILAFVFIWYSSKKPTPTMTFGYHRTQLLGALGNLFIIWALALFLLVQAFDRIINQIYVKEPFVMLLISGIGLPINIIMYFVLHDGGHSHGLMAQECGHEHPDAIVCHEELCEDVECLINQEYVDHCHKKKGEKQEIHSHNTKVTIDDHKNIIRKKSDDSKNKIMEEDLRDQVDMKQGLNSHQHKHGVDHEAHNIQHRSHCHDHDHDHDHGHSHDHGHDHDHDHEHGHDHGHSHGHSHQNMSMKAAVVHALSDIIFSIGLVIASLVIFFFGSDNGKSVTQWNNWHYFDPCVTIIFTGLVFLSTWPITQNCYYIIMESTPPNFSREELEKDFMKVKGVRDVHDLHVWDLRPGKTILTAHVFSEKDQQRYVLKELTDICRHKKIYHSTLQVQEQAWKDHEEYILCDHDIH